MIRDPQQLIRPDLERIPEELTIRPQWVLWKLGRPDKNGKLRKIPCDPQGEPINAHDRGNWLAFEAAGKAYEDSRGQLAGLGFVPAGCGIIGIDFDSCVKNGTLDPRRLKEIHAIGSYSEISPSGEGVRVFAFGKLPKNGMKNDAAGVELYQNGRFLTVTGHTIPGLPTDVEDATGAISALYERYSNDENPAAKSFEALTDENSHDWLVRYAARLVSKGLEADEIKTLGQALIETRITDPGKLKRRLAEWPRMVESAFQKGFEPDRTKKQPQLGLITFAKILNEKPQAEPLITGLLDRGEVAVIVGQAGIGKSLLMNQIFCTAAAATKSTRLFNRFDIPEPLTCVLLQSENEKTGFYTRLSTLMEASYGLAAGMTKVNVVVYSATGGVRVRGNILSHDFQAEIVGLLRRTGADLLGIDPLISFHEADENDNTMMRRVMDVLLQKIVDATGVGVIIPHHPPKTGTGPRGAGAIGDTAHCIVELSYHDPKKDRRHILCENTKNRNHAEFRPMWFEKTEQLNFVRCNKPLAEGDQEKVDAVVEALKEAGELTYTNLATAVEFKLGVSNRTAKKAVRLAQEIGVIMQTKMRGKGGPKCCILTSNYG